MNRTLKILLYAFVALAGLLVALIVAVSTIDANRFRPQITKHVEASTHRKMHIGDLHWSVFPVLGIRARQVSIGLGDPKEFGDQPFAEVGEVEVGVRLMPLLLHRELRIKRVHVVDAHVMLIVSENGHKNWEEWHKAAAGKRADAGEAAEAAEQAAEDAEHAAEQAEAQGAKHGEVRVEVEPLVFALAGVDVEHAAVELDDRRTHRHYAVHDLNLHTGAIAPGAPFGIDLTLQAHSDDPVVDASLQAEGQLSVDTELQRLSAPDLQLQLDAKGAGLPRGAVQAKLRTALQVSREALSLEGMQLKLDDSTLSGKFAAQLAQATQAGAVPAVQFALQIDQLNLDRYAGGAAAPDAAAATKSPGAKSAAAEADAPLPVAVLDGVDAEGSVQIGALTAHGAHASQVQLQIHAEHGGDKRQQTTAQFYGGSLSATTTIAAGAAPRLTQTAQLKSIDVGALLRDLSGDDKLSGHGSIDLNLNSVASSAAEIKRKLGGKFSFNLHDAAYKGINLGELARAPQALLNGQQAAPAAAGQTDFGELSGNGHISGGVVHLDGLDGKAPQLRVAGSGTVDLVSTALNLDLLPSLVNTSQGQGGRDVAQLSAVTIPVHVGGTMAKPSYQFDVKQAVRQQAVDKLTNRLNEKSPGLGDALKGFGALFGKHADEHTDDRGDKSKTPQP